MTRRPCCKLWQINQFVLRSRVVAQIFGFIKAVCSKGIVAQI
ncbi:hypothetical protein Patl1_10532 [Pistacia atlantica]|uniref:Uncharacterized protein n=1 Tax=Pistacia atlantica TaxID=434234 RepID=A0ACC1A6G5_9ROSI|nr:hypothetical protein Patl1_10532 [Pistacia atlantica]